VYDLISQVFVASVVNLEVVPWPFRFIAESAMRNVYQELVAKLPDRLTDKDYIYILPDWDGTVTKAVGLHDVQRTAGIVVLDAEGTIVGMYQGEEPEETMMALLATIINKR
jgi:cytochrome oxidase Cu insertion factor (SCO1/SenC/PrrC family)